MTQTELESSALAYVEALLAERDLGFPADECVVEIVGTVQDDSGRWWARLIATPPASAMIDPAQFFLTRPVGDAGWSLVDEGTDVDSSQFPSEVWDAIGYPSDAGDDGSGGELSAAAITYAEDLGGTSHEGAEVYLVIGASVESEVQAQSLLDEAIPSFGDMQSYFIVQRSDNFAGLDPGWWVVVEAHRDAPSEEDLQFGRRGFPDAYVQQVTVATSDPIPVVEEILGQ